MSARKDSSDHRRFRLAANDNETIVDDELDTEGHRLATNDTEITAEGTPRARLIEDDPSTTLGQAPGLSNH
jgi:hypothetical protein